VTTIELLWRVMGAAEVLSAAMVEEPWSQLTAAIQAVYQQRWKEQK
jgi:hypothetical protein